MYYVLAHDREVETKDTSFVSVCDVKAQALALTSFDGDHKPTLEEVAECFNTWHSFNLDPKIASSPTLAAKQVDGEPHQATGEVEYSTRGDLPCP